MQIRNILQEKKKKIVVTIDADQTIHDAIGKLNEHSIGALMVTTESGEIAGIITERDILRECGEHCRVLQNPSKRAETACPSMVRDAMTKELVIGVPDDGINYAMGVMTKNRIRHLPILENGKLAGIISTADLINVHLEEKVFKNRTLRNYINARQR